MEGKKLFFTKDQSLAVDISNGPCQDRGCTDILFCLLFIAFIVGMVVVAILGFTQGNPNLLIYPYDENGRSCGLNITGYPYIYFYNAVQQLAWGGNSSLIMSQSFCVASCPSDYSNFTLNCTPPLSNNNKSCNVSLQNLYLSSPCNEYILIISFRKILYSKYYTIQQFGKQLL